MTAETPADLAGMRAAGALVRCSFQSYETSQRTRVYRRWSWIRLPGRCLQRLVRRSAPQLFYDFPGATCISVNEHAAHGIPGERRLSLRVIW